MLRAVWFRNRAIDMGVPASGVPGGLRYAWSSEQLRRGPVFRVLRLYNWAIGASCGATLLFGKALGSRLAILRNREIDHAVLQLLGRYIQELLVANLVIVGALLVRGPWAHDVLTLLRDLAQRHSRTGAAAVDPRYAQGALLAARVTLVAPSLVLTALLLVERRPERFLILGTVTACLMMTIILVSSAVGVAAVYVRRSVRKHAVWVWFGLWVVPEALRSIAPSLPTPRTLIGIALEQASLDWGLH